MACSGSCTWTYKARLWVRSGGCAATNGSKCDCPNRIKGDTDRISNVAKIGHSDMKEVLDRLKRARGGARIRIPAHDGHSAIDTDLSSFDPNNLTETDQASVTVPCVEVSPGGTTDFVAS